MSAFSGLVLLHPWMLLFALAIPLALWLRARRPAPAARFAPYAFVAGEALPGELEGAAGGPLPPSLRARLAPLPRALQVLGLAAIALALARPVAREALPLTREGIDVLLCLDTSSSMDARDLDPARTRLDVARTAALRFVAARPDDRVGLIRFARFPDLVSPPTLDHAALAKFLDAIELAEADGPEDRTGIGTAVARAAEVLARSSAKSRVVVLLTDGEENVATAQTPDEIGPLRAARLCSELGVRVYAIVAGRGTPTSAGRWLPLDTSQVEALALATGGAFFAAPDAEALASVYATIDALEKAELAAPRYAHEERFMPFLLTALVLLALGRLLEVSVFEVLP